MAAYVVSRWRATYQQPGWIPGYAAVKLFDLVQGIIFYGMSVYHLNNQWFRHMTGPVCYLGLIWTMFRMAPRSRGRRVLYGLCAAVGLAAAIAGFALNGIKLRNSLFTSTICLMYLGLVTWEMKALAQSNEDAHLTNLPAFWVLAALLVYSSGTLIFNASSNYFLRTLPPHLLPIPWVIVGIVHAIHEVMLAKAFLCPKPTSS